MKQAFLILVAIMAFKGLNGQVVKSFVCAGPYRDSSINVYHVRIAFNKKMNKDSTLKIVEAEVERRLQIQHGKILRINTSIAKQYRAYNYEVWVAK